MTSPCSTWLIFGHRLATKIPHPPKTCYSSVDNTDEVAPASFDAADENSDEVGYFVHVFILPSIFSVTPSTTTYLQWGSPSIHVWHYIFSQLDMFLGRVVAGSMLKQPNAIVALEPVIRTQSEALESHCRM